MPPLWLIKAGALLALLAGLWLHGRHTGAEAERQAQAEAAEAERQAQAEAAEAQREANRLRARAAEAGYEAQRAALARRPITPSPEVAHALAAPICPPGTPLQLGDVPVPGAVLDRLRRAGADF